MRWTRALVLVAILVLMAACGGGGPAESAGGDGNGNGDGTSQSEPAEASAAPPPDDGNGNGGGPAGDLEELLDALEPPNSTEVSRTSAENFLFVIFSSTDSAESLADFYENAIADAGYDTITRSETQGTYSWIFGDDANANAAGVVGVGPTTDGGPGAAVSIQLGAGE